MHLHQHMGVLSAYIFLSPERDKCCDLFFLFKNPLHSSQHLTKMIMLLYKLQFAEHGRHKGNCYVIALNMAMKVKYHYMGRFCVFL